MIDFLAGSNDYYGAIVNFTSDPVSLFFSLSGEVGGLAGLLVIFASKILEFS